MVFPTRAAALGAVTLTAAACVLAAVPAWADAAVNGSRRTEMLDCVGADAVVNGDSNRLVFQGNCRSLRINGAGNVVQVDLTPGGTVNVIGDGNHVIYQPIDPGPLVDSQGNGDQIAPGSVGDLAMTPALPDAPPPPPPSMTLTPVPTNPAATLVLDGEAQTRDVNCAGQNVLIRGSDGRFVLRGGCVSLTVQGRADTIQADLQPGARVAIGGDAVTMNYTLTSDGPPPRVTVTGANSQATYLTRTPGPTVVTQPGSTTIIGNQQ
jgi:hypothetical protein